MKKTLLILTTSIITLSTALVSNAYSQTYNLVQTFEAGGTGTDNCWTGYNATSVPSTNDFFTASTPVQSGIYCGGMYSCCGGASSNNPTYYISPVITNGVHNVKVYLRQSSSFNENFEIGVVSDAMGTGFTASYTKSVWPGSATWELTNTSITTTSTNNRIAFRVPPASLKTYYLDSIVISNSGNATSGCSYLSTSVNEISNAANSVSIYPIPSNGIITIDVQNIKEGSIKVINVLGDIVYQTNIGNQKSTINLTAQPTGIYFVQITDANKTVTNRKVVVQ